jgi:beta propeller repeat protein
MGGNSMLDKRIGFRKIIAFAIVLILSIQTFTTISFADIYMDSLNGYYLDDFEGMNQTNGLSSTINTYVHKGNITLEHNLYLGTGSDGDLYVNSPTVLWRGSKLYDANAGSTQIEPFSITGFESGDELLVINMMSGIWETAFVKNVSSPYLNLELPLTNSYYESSKAQIVHIWHYNNVTVNGSTLTPMAWNSDTGGILAFRAKDTVNLTSPGSVISATGKGFFGGFGGQGGYGGDQGIGGLGGMAGDTVAYVTFPGDDGFPGAGASGGNGYKGPPPAAYDVYVGGASGGRGGNFGYGGVHGQDGANGEGLGGGLQGSPAAGGYNPTSPDLTLIHLGGGGGGGVGGWAGDGGCGGGGGGGSINASGDGEDGGRGGDGGGGGGGGTGGGMIFFSCVNLVNFGEISTNGTQGSAGDSGVGGGPGGAGGEGAPAMVYINGSSDTSHWGAGGGGGGGEGGDGGGGGHGGAGGGGGSINIQAENINNPFGGIYIGGGSGGLGGIPGDGGAGGAGGAGGIDTYGGSNGESGENGPGGMMGFPGFDGNDGESGFIRLDYLNLTGNFSSPINLNHVQYKSSGEVFSKDITPLELVKWNKFTADTTVPHNTELDFYIINPSDDSVVMFGNHSQASKVNGGLALDWITVPSLKVKAVLRSEDTNLTPIIHSWNLSWEVTQPPTPENFKGELSKNGDHIALSWDAVSFWKDLTGYNIYRCNDGLSYYHYKSVSNVTLTYNDNGVVMGRTYKYKVTATSSPGLESDFSIGIELQNDKDNDLDGEGNSFDYDDDNDGIPDESDDYPFHKNELEGVGSVIRITDAIDAQEYPVIYGNLIAWRDMRNGNSDIFMFDLETFIEKPLVTTADFQWRPAIYRDKIVFHDYRIVPGDVYLCDMSANKYSQISFGAGKEDFPDIYGDIITYWVPQAPGQDQIYMYNLSSGIETKVSISGNNFYHAVYGNKIVYSNRNVFLYDINNGSTTQITNLIAFQINPAIFEDIIVWQDQRNGNWDIYMYDIRTGMESPICTNSADQWNVSIYGDKIVWNDDRNGNWDIYMYDLSTNTEWQITESFSDQMNPDIFLDKIVWNDNRNDENDIYMMDIDSDDDGVWDMIDVFPESPFEYRDTDSDGVGDNSDTDDDGDGYLDGADDFPLNPLEWNDFDGDGIGDNADLDDDNDGVLDVDDPNPYNPIDGLQSAIDEINITINDVKNTIAELQFDLDSLNESIADLHDTVNFLNQTIPIKINDLSLQLANVNESIQNTLTGLNETNILAYLEAMNTTLAADISNLLSSITGDIIALDSSLSDQLTNLLNNMSTNDDALRDWLDVVLAAIDTNLTDTKSTLEGLLTDLDTYVAGFNDSLQSDLIGISSALQQHDKNTGQNHSDIHNILDSLLSGNAKDLDLKELKNTLSNLVTNISLYNESIAQNIEKAVENIANFEDETGQKLNVINNTLDDLAKLDSILTDLEDLNSTLKTAEDEIEASLDEIPTDKKEEEEAFGIMQILLVIIMALLLVVILLLVMGNREKSKDVIPDKPKEKIDKILEDEKEIPDEKLEEGAIGEDEVLEFEEWDELKDHMEEEK